MIKVAQIAQPTMGTTLDAIGGVLNSGALKTLDVAVAYATSGGVHDFLRRAEASLGDAWGPVQKRWITSFDYCRSDPLAIKALSSLPTSTVRIHDAAFCLRHRGTPRLPFHPKAFLFQNPTWDYAITGSGNLSRSGLSKGVEAGLTVAVKRHNPAEQTSVASINSLRTWFSSIWGGAARLDVPLLNQYTALFDSADRRREPTPTEDDLASSDSRGGLSSKDLIKLRISRNFWIEAGNITKNRGPGLPGNQLMMKRLSRVFFGFDPAAVPENSQIGNVAMAFAGGPVSLYSLTYSDNKMDKLVLPVPGGVGPPFYDNEYLLFTEVGPQLFELTLGTKLDRARWSKRSKAIDGAYRMSSGREWGVF